MSKIELRPENALEQPVRRFDIFVSGHHMPLGMWTFHIHPHFGTGVYVLRDAMGEPMMLRGADFEHIMQASGAEMISSDPDRVGPVSTDANGIQRATEALFQVHVLSVAASAALHLDMLNAVRRQGGAK